MVDQCLAHPQLVHHEPVTALPTGFDAFFTSEFVAVVAIVRSITGESLFAEDIAQEAMVRAADHWDRVGTLDSPGAWVRRVAINLAISRRRSSATETSVRERLAVEIDGAVAPPGLPDDGDIWTAVGQLGPQQRVAVTLHYLEGHDAASIAEILGCSAGTARVHLHRGRARLATMLDREED